MTKKWTHEESSRTWLYGEEDRGCGVYWEESGLWFGNVVHPYCESILGVGPYSTLEETQKMCENLFNDLEEAYQEEHQQLEIP